MSAYTERIEQYLRKHPGASRTEARGHGGTPERPGRAENNQEKYRDYLDRRSGLERQIIAKKAQEFGPSDKFRNDRSARNVQEHPVTHRPHSLSNLKKALDFLNMLGSVGGQWSDIYDMDDREDWESILWYH